MANSIIVIVDATLPSWSFRSRLATHHDQWHPSSSSRYYLTTCRLATVISLFSLQLDLTHLTILVVFKVFKARFIFEVFAEAWIVKAVPSCGGVCFTSTLFKSCTLQRHLQYRTSDGSIFLSLMLSVNSSNATSLYSHVNFV